eukprot:2536125-Amphidinium_carterae.1
MIDLQESINSTYFMDVSCSSKPFSRGDERAGGGTLAPGFETELATEEPCGTCHPCVLASQEGG